jgi:hypothetical protein
MPDTDTTNTNQEEEPLKDITLEPGIYDFTPQIRDHIANGTPLSDEVSNVLKTFNEYYDFKEDIRQRGREALLSEIDSSLKVFDFENAKEAVNKGLLLSQSINPDIKLQPFPTIFLFIPHRGDATSLYHQGCGINIDALKEDQFSKGTPLEKIASFSAHEGVHTFLKQLDKCMPERVKTRKEEIYSFMWEEGLTTYIEPLHFRHHAPIFEDAKFWVKKISEWVNTNDINIKKQLHNEIVSRPSFIQWFRDMWGTRRPIPEESNDELFSKMLKQNNGPAYHVGACLWSKQIEKGNSLKDLVMAGYGNMEQWIQDAIKE